LVKVASRDILVHHDKWGVFLEEAKRVLTG
jgi:hypothetical protein